MLDMIKSLVTKYKDVVLYLFFGVCTTLVNIVVYWASAHIWKLPVLVSTVIAWLIAVLFAYVTNRIWVFHSQAKGIRAIAKEFVSFIACRLATGLVDMLCMFVFVTILGWNDVIIKALANVLVIILNYIASKLVIFRQR